MIEALVFPDVRGCLFDLINGTSHYVPAAGKVVTVRATYFLQADSTGSIAGPYPVAQIYTTGGTEGYVDRVDRVTLEVYAPGEQAAQALESIRASVVGDSIETPSGYLDKIETETVPVDIPYQSDTLNRATASFLVTSRPITN